MYDVRISDSLYQRASQAARAHHVTVDEFIEKVVQESLKEGSDAAIQGLFTPALLAEIDAAGADMEAGNFRTQEQVDASLAATKARWLAANPG